MKICTKIFSNNTTNACLYIIVATVIFSCISYFLLTIVFMKPRWEAIGVLSIGHVAGYIEDRPVEKLLEPTFDVMETLKRFSFGDQAIASITSDVASKALFRNTLRVKLTTSGNLEIKLHAFDEITAKKLIFALVKPIKAVHDSRFEDAKNLYEDELENNKARINDFSKTQQIIKGKLKSNSSIELLRLKLNADLALADLQEKQNLLKEKLDDKYNYRTTILGDVITSTSPVYPNKYLVGILSCYIAIFIGFIVAVVFRLRRL